MESTRGQLLIAGPRLQDPNFWRTVVLVIEHNEEGALGLVLNRPSESSVGDAVPELGTLVNPGEQLYIGVPEKRPPASRTPFRPRPAVSGRRFSPVRAAATPWWRGCPPTRR